MHRYCRALSRSVWDAEDLLQETLLRAFARLGDLSSRVDNPKAYLLRIASNLWIDQIRSAREIVASQIDMLDEPERSLEVREAATRLIELLSPQERAAVVLKDVFEFQLDEIAAILGTTTGAVKSALHGGRHKLTAPPRRVAARPSAQLVDRFVELFNSREIEGLTRLLRSDSVGEIVSMGAWEGPAAIRDNPLYYALFLEEGDPGAERRLFFDEPIMLVWYASHSGESRAVRNVVRFEEIDGQVARLQFFTLCPQTLVEIAATFGAAVKTNGYGPWSPEFIAMRKHAQYLAWIAGRTTAGERR